MPEHFQVMIPFHGQGRDYKRGDIITDPAQKGWWLLPKLISQGYLYRVEPTPQEPGIEQAGLAETADAQPATIPASPTKRRGRPAVFASRADFEKKLRHAVQTLDVEGPPPVTAQAVADYWTKKHPYYLKRRQKDGKDTTCHADQVFKWCDEFLGKPFSQAVTEILNGR